MPENDKKITEIEQRVFTLGTDSERNRLAHKEFLKILAKTALEAQF